jgi:hypothetical protein
MSTRPTPRIRALVQGPWGWFPLLSIVAGFSALLLAAVYSTARLEMPVPGGELLYWIAFPLPVVPVVVILLRRHRPRRERVALVVLLGVWLFWPDLLRSPASFSGYDELLHQRALEDILRFGHLFHSNPLLIVSPYFPDLEIVTSAIAKISGADPFASGVVLLGFIRILFATGLFLLFEEVASSARVAGLAAVVYMMNPSFAFFDGSFAYESLALPLVPMILFVTARWARSSSAGWRARLGLVLGVLLATLIISHHLTSYGLAALLVGWAVLHVLVGRRDRYGGSVAMVALVAVLGVVVWLFSVASLTLGYLIPPLSGAVQQMIRLITTGEGRQLFQSATGDVAPLWERVAGIGATGILLAWLPVGLVAIWVRLRSNSLALLLLLVGLGYPASLVLRLTPTGSEAAGRSSALIYIGLAFVVAQGILAFGDFVQWLRPRLHLSRSLSSRLERLSGLTAPWRIIAAAGFGVMALGSVIVGTLPATRLPGTYLVGADSRSIDAESRAAASWALEVLGPDRRFAADRVNRLLLGSYGTQHVVFAHSERVESWQLFLSPDLDQGQRARLVVLNLAYVLIDRRLSESLPLTGFYYEEGEIYEGRHTTPISATVLGKWDSDPAVDRVFDSGDLQIYDVRRISHAP